MISPVTQETRAQRSWFVEALGEVSSFAGRLFKNFFRFLFIGLAATAVFAVIVYLATFNGETWRGIIGSMVTVLGGSIATILISMQMSVVAALAETIRIKRLSAKVLDALFAALMGVDSENPQGNLEITRTLHGLPVSQLKRPLSEAGKRLIEDRISGEGLSFVPRWLINKALRLVVWATIRVVIRYCTAEKKPGDNVDLLALRANLTAMVDQMVVERLYENLRRFALLVALVAAGACWLIVIALNRLST